jgi:hypothetical protein
MPQFLSTADVAAMYRVPDWKIRRLFEDGNVAEPPQISGRRIIDQSTLPQIVKALCDRGWWLGTAGKTSKLPSDLALV